MTKKIIKTDSKQASKFCAFQIMLVLNSSGITVHKNSLERLRKSLQKNLDLDRVAKLYDDFLVFRINNKRRSPAA